jgi:hypothetical protein
LSWIGYPKADGPHSNYDFSWVSRIPIFRHTHFCPPLVGSGAPLPVAGRRIGPALWRAGLLWRGRELHGSQHWRVRTRWGCGG